MAYTVRQVARMSGVSVRTLHFYDETALLKPASHAANGYRLYEEPQLLTLQQILFYRELGFELKQIKDILGRADFEKVAALRSHREVLEETLARARTLLETIDRTTRHLRGEEKMTTEDMFAGFTVAPGRDRFEARTVIGGEPNDCKISAKDTGGAMCAFEWAFESPGSSNGPRHLHLDQDEWVYVLQGKFEFEVGDRKFQASAGESVFLPRRISHAWVCRGGSGKVLDVFQPAGNMEDFFRELGRHIDPPLIDALSYDQICGLFQAHGMKITGPPIPGEWRVEEGGRVTRIA